MENGEEKKKKRVRTSEMKKRVGNGRIGSTHAASTGGVFQ